MPHSYVFPYSENESGEFYIFSAADCPCTHVEFDHAQEEGVITEAYKDLLLENLYAPTDDAPHSAYWATI
jgi:hypothetical protein